MAKSPNGGNKAAGARASARRQSSSKARQAAGAKPAAGTKPAASPKPSVPPSRSRRAWTVYDKVVWYCLHLLVILVPIAMIEPHVPRHRQRAAAHLRPVRHREGLRDARGDDRRAGRVGLEDPHERAAASAARRSTGSSSRFLAWVAAHDGLLDPSGHRALRQVPPLRGLHLVRQLRGDLLPRRPDRRPAVPHPLARALAVHRRGARRDLRRCCSTSASTRSSGATCRSRRTALLDVRQPRPARRLPHVPAAHRARDWRSRRRARSGGACTGSGSPCYGGVWITGVRPRRLDRRQRRVHRDRRRGRHVGLPSEVARLGRHRGRGRCRRAARRPQRHGREQRPERRGARRSPSPRSSRAAR